MTIDNFGRHIHKHIIKRHLLQDDVLSTFVKHRKVEELLKQHVQGMPTSKKDSKMYTITVYSDGSISPTTQMYKLSSDSQSNVLYKNELYEGHIVKVNYSNDAVIALHVGRQQFDPTSVKKKYKITKGTKLFLKYIGPLATPSRTPAVYTEILIEGDVIH